MTKEKRVRYRHNGKEYAVPLRLIAKSQQYRYEGKEFDYEPEANR